ncbi:MAG: spermidine/putrescine ABC transporter ATP-binding protein [Bacillota bacterium]
MAKHLLELIDVTKDYGETVALRHINLYIRQNEFLTLLGPSGCGKTTMLRIIAGFEMPTGGRVLFDGEDLVSIPPYRRRVNTVFQRYALFPHLNVFENIAFGLRIKKMDKAVVSERVLSMLRLVNLSGMEKRPVESLSGGQQQRVAIARALVNQPEMLLLDEPLGALDLKLRKEMQLELKAMQQRLGITFLYVTHDQEEALTMSDTIAVMKDGEIQQIGTPVDIYNEPKNAYVADFIGESNIIDGVMQKDYAVHLCGRTFACVDAGFAPDENVDVVVRPEDVHLVGADEGMLKGVVHSIVFMGVHYEIRIDCGGYEWLAHTTKSAQAGETVGLSVDPDGIHIMHKGEDATCSSAP